MRLSHVLSPSAIAVGLEGHDKWTLIEKLTDLLVESDQARPEWRDVVLKGLVEREKQSSTGMQDGFAIPHCRVDDPLEGTLVSLAVVRGGMEFDAIDGQPTQLVVCLVTPRKQNKEHLRILAGIAQLFNSARFRERLLTAQTAEEALQVIQEEEENLA